MAKKRRARLRFPLGGLVRDVGFQVQRPFTTPDCLNVRALDKATGRLRGGTRPGLKKDMTLDGTFQALGTAGSRPIRFIRTMGVAQADQFTHWADRFNTASPSGIVGRGWTYSRALLMLDKTMGLGGQQPLFGGQPVGDAIADDVVFKDYNTFLSVPPARREQGPSSVARSLSIDVTQPYSISLDLLMHDNGDGEGKIHRGEYYIYAALNRVDFAANDDDVIIDGFEIRLALSDPDEEFTLPRTAGFWQTQIIRHSGSSITNISTQESTFSGGDKNGRFTVTINGGDVTVWFDGQQLDAVTGWGAAPSATGIIGFGMDAYAVYDDILGLGVPLLDPFTIVDGILVQYFQSGGNEFETENRLIVVASAGGELYREEDIGDLESESGAASYATLNDDAPLQVEEQNQKLYIADRGDILADYTDGSITGTALTSASVADFTDMGSDNIDLNAASSIVTWVVRTYDVQSAVVEGTYKIASATSGTLTLASAPGNGSTSFRIERAAKVYDPSDGTLSIWTTGVWETGNTFSYPLVAKGFVPDGCHLVTTYRRRLVLAGNPPFVFYMSRVNDPLDFYFAARSSNPEDLLAATGGAVEGAAGTFLTGVIPFTDDYLLFTSKTRMDMLRGDLNLGGEIDSLSREIGMIGEPGRVSNAFCYGPTGEVVILSQDGVYIINPGEYPQSISAIVIPRELFDIDPVVFDIAMRYDAKDHGVHIFVTPRSGESNEGGHYWMNWEAKSFWPMSFPSAVQPTAIGARETSATGFSVVMIGGKDGFIRRFSYNAETDDGTNIPSHILIGPFRISGNDVDEGIFSELNAEVSHVGGGVTWSLWVGDSPESVTRRAIAQQTPDETGTWNPGVTNTDHPNRVGMAAILKLSNASGRAWSIERLTAALMRAGIQRLE